MSIFLILLFLLGFTFLAHVFKCFTKDYFQGIFVTHLFKSFPKNALIGIAFTVGLIGGEIVMQNFVPYGNYSLWGHSDNTEVTTVEVTDDGTIMVTESDGTQYEVGASVWSLRKIAGVFCILMLIYLMPKLSLFMTSSAYTKDKLRPWVYPLAVMVFLAMGSTIGGTLVWILAFFIWDYLQVSYYKKHFNGNIIEYVEGYQKIFAPRLSWVFVTFLLITLLAVVFGMGA